MQLEVGPDEAGLIGILVWSVSCALQILEIFGVTVLPVYIEYREIKICQDECTRE
jgi:hypothetical protein